MRRQDLPWNEGTRTQHSSTVWKHTGLCPAETDAHLQDGPLDKALFQRLPCQVALMNFHSTNAVKFPFLRTFTYKLLIFFISLGFYLFSKAKIWQSLQHATRVLSGETPEAKRCQPAAAERLKTKIYGGSRFCNHRPTSWPLLQD